MPLHRLMRLSSLNRSLFNYVFISHNACSLWCPVFQGISANKQVQKWFHKSAIHCKRRKTAEEKKIAAVRPLVRLPTKSKLPPIEIWKNMTVGDIATALDRNVGHVFEAMSFIPNTSYYKKSSSIVDNVEVMKEVVRISGRKSVIVSPPVATDFQEGFRDKDVQRQPSPAPEILVNRPPVVTIMGHVDHGKTTLLDSLRNTRVVDAEFGGITQHIGAFSVKLKSGENITFLDTPGHAAFSSMRARGANATDIVVLVVAADDGVMEQTIESIKMANNAKVPIIVAMNKMDKPVADPERVKRMLVQHGLQVEDAGGDVQVVPISALKGTNLDTLTEAIVLQAELMGLQGDPHGMVEGVVIESHTDPGRGKVSTAIIKRGTLRKGTVLVAGTVYAKVRVMLNEEGRTIDEAPPSAAVQVLGWKDLPSAGEEILEVASEKVASEVVRWREQQKLMKKQEEDQGDIKQKVDEHLAVYKSQLEKKRMMGYKKIRQTGPRKKEAIGEYVGPMVNLIVKGDVDGSVEAILDVLDSYDCNIECKLNVVHYGVGFVTDYDVELANTFQAIIYGFNVNTPQSVKKEAKSKNVTLRSFNIIYRLIEDLKKELSSKLPPKEVQETIGEAHVLQHFDVTEGKKKVAVAGCRCTKGELKKANQYKVLRGDDILYEGKVDSIRHLKNEVNTIKKDVECGLMFSEFKDEFQLGDTIICFQTKSVPQTTAWDPGF